MTTSAAPLRCQSCGSPQISPIGCFDCHSIYPSHSEINHFQRIGLPTRFAIDLKELDRLYLVWSRELHPDFFQLRSGDDQRLSLNLSSALNDAYRTLKDPFLRAEYLLGLIGGPSASNYREMPAGFLEAILETRMELEEAKESGSNGPELAKLEATIEADKQKAMSEVGQLFGELFEQEAKSPSSADKIKAIRERLNKVKYLDGLLREIIPVT